jgi:hypothetical protein
MKVAPRDTVSGLSRSQIRRTSIKALWAAGLIGCIRPAPPTTLIGTQDPTSLVASSFGTENVVGSSSGQVIGGDIRQRDFQFHVKTSSDKRDAFLREYRSKLIKLLTSDGAVINGDEREGELSGFALRFSYSNSRGIVRVKTMSGESGLIQFDIFIYEHG